MKHDLPIKQRYNRRNSARQSIINEEVDELLAHNLIEPSYSAYSSPVVIVKKKQTMKTMRILQAAKRALRTRCIPGTANGSHIQPTTGVLM